MNKWILNMFQILKRILEEKIFPLNPVQLLTCLKIKFMQIEVAYKLHSYTTLLRIALTTKVPFTINKFIQMSCDFFILILS